MAAPRAVKDSDTALWLHNKLGSAEELWVSSSIGGIIKTDTIDNIYRCFPVLTSTVKMKLLLGILHLPRRNLDEMKHTIEGLVELALEDTDQWVRLVAELVKTYPMRGKLNLDLSSNSIASTVIEQLREKVNDSSVFSTLPLECQYVNKNALQSLVGSQPPPVRHFALKRKPKSAALRVDLMQRSSEASNQVKKEKTVPVKHRDMTRKFSDASPMRGIPKASPITRSDSFRSQVSLNPGVGSRTISRFSSRSERGTKLLDISEQPMGIREQKRRKKQQEDNVQTAEASEDKVEETPDYAAGLPQTIASSDPVTDCQNTSEQKEFSNKPENQEEDYDDNDVEMEEEDSDQDHFVPNSPQHDNLSSIDQNPSTTPEPEPQEAMSVPKKVSEVEKRPSVEELPVYAMPATPSPYFRPVVTHSIVPSQPRQNSLTATSHTSNQLASRIIASTTGTPTSPLQPKPNLVLSQPNASQSAVSQLSVPSASSYPPTPGFYTPVIRQEGAVTVEMQRQTQVLGHPSSLTNTVYNQPLQIRPTGVQFVVQPNTALLQQFGGQTRGFTATPRGTLLPHQVQSVDVTNTQALQRQIQVQQVMQQQAAQQTQPKKTLTLSREQMDQAQDIFKSANRLSRQEKSIILGFMAGSRDNPTPEKGDIVQITLSEHEQAMQNPSGGTPIPVVVETYYEMNYRTGSSFQKQRYRRFVTPFNAGNV